MTTPLPPRRIGRPRKIVQDEARAAELLAELVDAEVKIRSLTDRRFNLVVEASELGVTVEKIGSTIGTSQSTVSKWIRSAKPQTD